LLASPKSTHFPYTTLFRSKIISKRILFSYVEHNQLCNFMISAHYPLCLKKGHTKTCSFICLNMPLLIYSPLLKTGATFNHIVSHFDLAPSILAYYRKNYDLETPQFVTWLGKGLHAGASVGGIPIMQSKYQQEDFIVFNYHYNNKSLFKLDYNLNEEESEEDSRGKFVKQQFDDFMLKNREFIKTRRLVPDSIFNGFFK